MQERKRGQTQIKRWGGNTVRDGGGGGNSKKMSWGKGINGEKINIEIGWTEIVPEDKP